MRIHLPLHPHHLAKQPLVGPSSAPLAQLGGDLVIIELQGELTWEGDKTNGVVGVIGLDRPDKPTLHLGPHHLLHGKFVTLQKPYAVIRKAIGQTGGTELEGDQSEEEAELDDEEDEALAPSSAKKRRLRTGKAEGKREGKQEEKEEEDEEEPPLFAPDTDILPSTPLKTANKGAMSSSPFYASSAPGDYSSELDPASSPARFDAVDDDDDDDDDDEDDDEGGMAEERARREAEQEEERRRKARYKEKRRSERKERTRHYEVVGIVRKKVVFHLRPEPIVTATILPE